MTADLPHGYRFESLDASRWDDVQEMDTWSFPSPHSAADLGALPVSFTWGRSVGVAAEGAGTGELVAHHSSYPFAHFPVPGGELATAGLTWVGVHPQHRRRGILRAMVARHLADCRRWGEPLSALFAAEAPIYGRFGYGHAADDLRLTIPRPAALRDVPGAEKYTVRLDHASQERHGDLVDRLHRAAGRAPTGVDGINRPGWATRETPELQAHFWSDPPIFREGREDRRIAIAEQDGEPRGYAFFRRTLSWEPAGPRGSTMVGEIATLDPAAARALWAVLLDFDLMADIRPNQLPVDDPLTRLLVDRRAALPRVADNLWIRIVDLPKALAGRRYAADVDVVLAVTDELVPGNVGNWRLTATAFGPAAVEPAQDVAAADLEVDVQSLGAAYLGGVSLASLASAGLVRERRPGALAMAAVAFGWPVAPVCSWVF